MIREVAAALAFVGILATFAGAAVKGEEVAYRDGETVLSGYLAYEKEGPASRPGILVVHEWWGLNDYVRRRVEQLAGLGYVAFAADIYGKGRVTADAKQAAEWAAPFRKDRALMRSRARAALAVLAGLPRVDAKRIAAVGYCFGGTVALELARAGEDLAGVVSFHGGLDTPSPAARGAVRARVLVLSGGDDPFVPAAQRAAFEHEMREGGGRLAGGGLRRRPARLHEPGGGRLRDRGGRLPCPLRTAVVGGDEGFLPRDFRVNI